MTCSTGVTRAVTWCLEHPQIHLDCMAAPRPGDLHMTPLMHVLKHVTAGSKHVTAGSKHVTAGSKHVTAGSKHVTAGSKHVTAGSKHVICAELIDAGCDVGALDSANWTMLHYATIHNNPEILTMIIKSAPIHPRFTYGKDCDDGPPWYVIHIAMLLI